MMDRERHCYRVKLPTEAEARRLLGIEKQPGYTPHDTYRADAILCGSFGPPCVHCGGIPEALCDFPLGDEGRTCDRSLCLECAPNIAADGTIVDAAKALPEADYKNYCREHSDRSQGMLLFLSRCVTPAPAAPPPRRRAKPLPKSPPEPLRWRVRQRHDGAVLTDWVSELEARRFAARVGGHVETWDQFVALWRQLYPLKNPPRTKR